MKMFFITYGNNLINCYSVIHAEDYAAARKVAFDGTDGGKFAFMYEGEEELARQVEKFGIREIKLQPMKIGEY